MNPTIFSDQQSEGFLLDLALQLLLVSKYVHRRGLTLGPLITCSKILVTDNRRFMINCGGMQDAMWDATSSAPRTQPILDDLVAVAKLLMSIVSPPIGPLDLTTCETIRQGARQLSGYYSPTMISLLETLCDPVASADDALSILSMVSARKVEGLMLLSDMYRSEAIKTVASQQLLETLVKICMTVDRPNLCGDNQWSRTGDRYIVELFRDHIFFQSDESGMRPSTDMGHILGSLLKATRTQPRSGEDTIMLVTRDNLSVILSTFPEIQRCIESSFNDVISHS
jgi:PAB-dependent poly(A)-specific ribonuclease subunit 3